MRWSFYLSIEIFSKMTTLLEITNFLRLTIYLAKCFCLYTEYLNSSTFLSLSIHVLNTLTYSRCFLGFLLLLSTKKNVVKGANVGSPWLDSAYDRAFFIKDTYIKCASTDSTCIISTYIGRTYTRGTCIGSTYTKKTWIEGVYIEDVCIGSICIVGPYARGF